MLVMPSPTTYIDDETPFNPKEWIRKGKKYSEVPYFVHLARQNAQAIPAEIIQQLPAQNMAILQFLKESLPEQSKEFNFYAPSTWFRNEEPTQMSVEEVFEIVWRRRTIPPKEVLRNYKRNFVSTGSMEASQLLILVSTKVMRSFPSGFFHSGYRDQKFGESRRTGEMLTPALWRRLKKTQSLQLNFKTHKIFLVCEDGMRILRIVETI
jgi:hypothetical protein